MNNLQIIMQDTLRNEGCCAGAGQRGGAIGLALNFLLTVSGRKSKQR